MSWLIYLNSGENDYDNKLIEYRISTLSNYEIFYRDIIGICKNSRLCTEYTLNNKVPVINVVFLCKNEDKDYFDNKVVKRITGKFIFNDVIIAKWLSKPSICTGFSEDELDCIRNAYSIGFTRGRLWIV